MELKIRYEDYEVIGSHSLLGRLMEGFLDGSLKKEGLVLKFQASTLKECEERPGPEILLMPEHVPMCLIEDVIKLVSEGIRVTIDTFHE